MLSEKISNDIYENFLQNVSDAEKVKNENFRSKVEKITQDVEKLLNQCKISNKDEVIKDTCNSIHSEGYIIKHLSDYVIKVEKSNGGTLLVNTLVHNLDISQIKMDILKDYLEK